MSAGMTQDECPKGYKITEVGVIPDDWHLKSLEKIALVTSGKRLPLGCNLTDHETAHPYIRVTDMRCGTVSLADIKFVPVEVFPAIMRYRIFKDDIFISVAGTLGIVGKIPPELNGANLTENADRITNISCSRNYLLHFLMSPQIQNTIDATQTVGAQPKLALTRIRKFDIPLPPTKAEQEAIAEALSEADALVESLEKVIAKKRQIKQGAMQELLTGKRRLPGFEAKLGYKQTEAGSVPEDWDTPEIGSILKAMQLGGNYENSERESNWPLIKMGNLGRGRIHINKLEFIPSTQAPASRDRLKPGDVLFNTRNTLDLVGKVAIWRGELSEAYFNSNIARMKFEEKWVSSDEFMNFIMNTPNVRVCLRGIATGTTSVAAIYGRDLMKIKVPLPTREEQKAIATILTDMDTEITTLETKLSKARQLKQAMMQELLTGRIRLI